MRKCNLFVLAAICAAALTIPAHGQVTNAAPAPTAPGGPGAPVGPRPNPQFRLLSVRNSIGVLDRAIGELKRSENDFDGHKQSAIDACTKAREELMAVAKSAGIPIPPARPPGQRPMPVPPAGAQPQTAPPPPAQQQPAAPPQ